MHTFEELGLATHRVEALKLQHIQAPADIQLKAYPTLSSGQDAWLSAPTGSGKTLAYLLPLLEQIDASTTDLQLAILAPTQELAVQLHAVIQSLEQGGSPAVRSQLLIGNASTKRQIEKLKKKPHVVVGTCGRMRSLAEERKLKLHLCKCVIIDEADGMLIDDTVEEIEALLQKTPRDRQLVFTSATDKGDAYLIAQDLCSKLTWIEGTTRETVSTIEHRYLEASYHHKAKSLQRLLETLEPERAMVFLHRNASAEELGEQLSAKGVEVLVLHGALSKFDREKALNRFRRGKMKVLIASDVAARGLDIKKVSHIINIDLPSDSGDYQHRAGRTGRMGAPGTTISIVTEDELKLVQRYERDLDIEIEPLRLHP